MKASVVDENVPIVANDATRTINGLPANAPQASDVSRLAAVKFLRELISSGVIVIDDAGDCLSRYRKYLSGKGQPGTGDAFLKHLFDNAHNPQRTEQVALEISGGEFAAFPKVAALKSFDRADRIYVALAITSSLSPSVANAVDSDYQQHREALAGAGVEVDQIC